MRIIWSPRARTHLIALRSYIAERNPRAAIAVARRIRDSVDQLAEYPRMGRGGRVAGTRELVITRTPYIVAYVVDADEVTILAILHGAQRWPEAL